MVGRIGESLKQVCSNHEIKLNVDSSDRMHIAMQQNGSIMWQYVTKIAYSSATCYFTTLFSNLFKNLI